MAGPAPVKLIWGQKIMIHGWVDESGFKTEQIFNNYNNLNKVFKTKNNFIMNAITGLDGLEPTLNSIKFTKNILIANKEAIICGWNLINRELKKFKTNFIPIDSEHFSIWSLLQNHKTSNIERILSLKMPHYFLRNQVTSNQTQLQLQICH